MKAQTIKIIKQKSFSAPKSNSHKLGGSLAGLRFEPNTKRLLWSLSMIKYYRVNKKSILCHLMMNTTNQN